VELPPVETERPVAPLELFFDLVFVFGFTQVTTLLSHNPTWTGLGHGLLILGALWWAWASYAWLTNTLDPDEGPVVSAMLVATGAMFVGALAVPEAFGNEGVVFGVTFLIVSGMWATLYALGAHGDGELVRAIKRVVPWSFGGAALILAAGFADGWPRAALWIAALILGFVGPGLINLRGWRVQPAHFVERHGLIVIIAIGEALVAIGIGAHGTRLDASVIVGAVLGLIVAMSFWLAYFDFFTIRARQLLSDRTGEDRVALARDVYTYLHLPMIAGIVLFAFAMKSTLAHLGDELGTIEAVALCGGPALYLFAYVALRFRVSRTLRGGRLVASIACALLIPVAVVVPALVALALVAGVWVALHAYELIWWREARSEARTHRFSGSSSGSAAT
jgi:low temperature requirement protein LtrA